MGASEFKEYFSLTPCIKYILLSSILILQALLMTSRYENALRFAGPVRCNAMQGLVYFFDVNLKISMFKMQTSCRLFETLWRSPSL